MAQQESIHIEGITFQGFHGVLDDEKRDGRRYSVDVHVTLALTKACTSDALLDTIDYRHIAAAVIEIGTQRRFNLLEALTHTIADAIEAICPAKQLSVTVKKHQPGLPGHPDCVALQVQRTQALIGA